MGIIRLTAYDNGNLVNEKLYVEKDTSLVSKDKAIARFRKHNPEYNNCILVAETYDASKNEEHFNACARCDCIY